MPRRSTSPPPPTRTRGRELAILSEIARLATEDLELRPMLQRVTDALAARLGWEIVALVRVEPEAGRFVCEAITASVPTTVSVGYSRPLGSGVVGEVALTGRPVLIDDVGTARNFVDTAEGIRAELCVPVKHRDEVVAILNLESTRPAAFRGQLRLAHAIAGQIAGAVASARLLGRLHQRAADLEILSDVSRAAVGAADLSAVLDGIAGYVRQRFDFYMVSIVVADATGSVWEHRAFATRRPLDLEPRPRWPVTAGVVGRAIRTGEPQLVSDVASDLDYFAIDGNVRAEFVVPIRFGGATIGALNCEDDRLDVFAAETRTVLSLVADQVAGAIQLAVLNQRLSQTSRDLADANRRLAAANESLARLSLSDPLTGLANRRQLDETLAVEWRRLARNHEPLAVLMLDVDCFKTYNDHYGHPQGDLCLRQVAATLQAGVQRAGDLVARYGGEEFAVVLPGCDLEAAKRVAETLRSAIVAAAIPHLASTVLPVLTVSIGVAAGIPEAKGHPDELVAAADRRLYVAKQTGRNQVVSRDQLAGRSPAEPLGTRP